MNRKSYWVYILASKKNGTIYIGITSDLKRRVYEHKHNYNDGFTKKYSIKNLVFAQEFQDIYEAINLEKKLKKWKRDWKVALIESNNPEWVDLYDCYF